MPIHLKVLFCTSLILLAIPLTMKAQDPIIEAIKAATKKVIRAIDLQVQRLQNGTIDLQNAQKQLENILSKLKLEEIADWTNKQKELYQAYFTELWKVKSYLMYYRQFKDVIGNQKLLFEEYKKAISIVYKDNRFSSMDKDYMLGVYANILDASIQDIADLLSFMQSFTLQVSDGARLEKLSVTADNIDNHLAVLRKFNERNKMLSTQRAKSIEDLQSIRQLYGDQ